MKRYYWLVMFATGCSQMTPEEQIIHNHYSKIGATETVRSLVTQADCYGPDGKYTTLTESNFNADYLFFEQVYEYRNSFCALIREYDEGFGLDSTYKNAGALSEAVIGVLKAHEFHELMLQVDHRFTELEQKNDTLFFGVDCIRIKAYDPLSLTSSLFFNKQTQRMEGFTQVNPYEKDELIQVHFEDWYEQDGLWLFDKLTILQGSKATYKFDYNLVEINSPTFKTRNI